MADDFGRHDYSFYYSCHRVIKRNNLTNECFSLYPFHSKEGKVGWLGCNDNRHPSEEITEEEARKLIRELIEWLANYCEMALSEQRIQELVQELIESGQGEYYLETEKERIIRYLDEGDYFSAENSIRQLMKK